MTLAAPDPPPSLPQAVSSRRSPSSNRAPRPSHCACALPLGGLARLGGGAGHALEGSVYFWSRPQSSPTSTLTPGRALFPIGPAYYLRPDLASGSFGFFPFASLRIPSPSPVLIHSFVLLSSVHR